MATAATPAVPEQQTPKIPPPGPMTGPPIIDGFDALQRNHDETFKEKLTRKTKENPFVPIGELHKPQGSVKLLKCSIETVQRVLYSAV